MAVHRLTPVIDPPELAKESSVAGPGLWNHSIDITGIQGSAVSGPLNMSLGDFLVDAANNGDEIMVVVDENCEVDLYDHILIMDMADNINIIIQPIGHVHRLGQLLQQCIWILCLNYTYDQWLWANAITKMMSQIVGEANIDKPALTHTDIEQAMEAMGTMDEAHVEETVSTMEDTAVKTQALDYIRRLMGARTDRSNWRTEDLAEPHRQQEFTMRRSHHAAMITSDTWTDSRVRVNFGAGEERRIVPSSFAPVVLSAEASSSVWDIGRFLIKAASDD
ncbi:hypothetical protein LTR72_002256 [Exophiala xenobiotica]|nr:hypothetical protein LTR72_002256 [Exophiala xenobiotica]KAK5302191.1 hypothetical protein LTR14_000440 [Exophiala xenobiotica]KAK5487431.1 hypothetical protein LTR55_004802 [Exophiala xenobiotica]